MVTTSMALALFLSTSAGPAQACGDFQACFEQGRAAAEAGDTAAALAALEAACDMTVAPVYEALYISSCQRIVQLSRGHDDYATAAGYFGERCARNSSKDCLFLGRLEEERDSLDRAMAILQPLCDNRFDMPAVQGYDACSHVDRINHTLAIRNPPPARDGRIQMRLFVAFLALTGLALLAVIGARVSRSRGLAAAAIGLSVVATGVYWYYETGIPPFTDIRIDLFIIAPVLLLLLVIVAAAAWTLVRGGTSRMATPGD